MLGQKKIVIKVGSSLVTNNGVGVDSARLIEWAGQIAILKQQGYQVVLVSSGSIAQGLKQLNWSVRPKKISELQAAAAIGQMGLAQKYQQIFKEFGIVTAQILLTHEDIRNRTRYLNARATILTLLKHDVVPIVNENDTVVTKEIKLGDNDTLGALVTNLIDAETYVILTDQDGLYDADPRSNPGAVLIHDISVTHPGLEQMAGGAGTTIGTGGMLTKVKAARRAASSGATTIVASGRTPSVIVRILNGEKIGTVFQPDISLLNAKQQWIKDQLIPAGIITIDEGATKVLETHEKSLLPVGCVKVEGDFKRGDVVSIKDLHGTEVARGLINYGSNDVFRILGCTSYQIEDSLGYIFEEELVHRDNMVFVE
ncbi:MAG: glutamate 5-kinase [Neisseriaceae bacterium]|nr:MAG: glutamate 5-kinase [Neisseriaceae bacterium]